MIGEDKLKEICNQYGIDYEKLVKNNSNVLRYGEYGEICDILNYLRNELDIAPKNIEKCPSILCFGSNNIKKNWEIVLWSMQPISISMQKSILILHC